MTDVDENTAIDEILDSTTEVELRIDEDKAGPMLTAEVELRIDKGEVKLTTEVGLSMDENEAVPKLTTKVEVEFKMDVGLKFRSAA